jgi:hypothetical protein
MRRVLIRYRLKPDQVERNEELVRAVYEELHRAARSGLEIADRCDEQPVLTELTEVGSYRSAAD